jgi:hypothetical protein
MASGLEPQGWTPINLFRTPTVLRSGIMIKMSGTWPLSRFAGGVSGTPVSGFDEVALETGAAVFNP